MKPSSEPDETVPCKRPRAAQCCLLPPQCKPPECQQAERSEHDAQHVAQLVDVERERDEKIAATDAKWKAALIRMRAAHESSTHAAHQARERRDVEMQAVGEARRAEAVSACERQVAELRAQQGSQTASLRGELEERRLEMQAAERGAAGLEAQLEPLRRRAEGLEEQARQSCSNHIAIIYS